MLPGPKEIGHRGERPISIIPRPSCARPLNYNKFYNVLKKKIITILSSIILKILLLSKFEL